MKIKNIIDCEVRLVHEKARNKNFMKGTNEGVIRDVYQHKKIGKAVKLWDINTLIKSMNKNSIKFAIVSGLAWSSLKVQTENNKYVKKPDKSVKEINVTFAKYNNGGITSTILR